MNEGKVAKIVLVSGVIILGIVEAQTDTHLFLSEIHMVLDVAPGGKISSRPFTPFGHSEPDPIYGYKGFKFKIDGVCRVDFYDPDTSLFNLHRDIVVAHSAKSQGIIHPSEVNRG